MGREVGLVTDARWSQFVAKREAIATEIDRLRSTWNNGTRWSDLLKRPEVRYDSLEIADRSLCEAVRQQVEIQLKYEGYIARDVEQIDRFKQLETKRIPPAFDYGAIKALRTESRQKLEKYRPDSIGQASRISGVTPADIAILLVWLKKAGK